MELYQEKFEIHLFCFVLFLRRISELVPYRDKVIVDLEIRELEIHVPMLDVLVETVGLGDTFKLIESPKSCSIECDSLIDEIKAIEDLQSNGSLQLNHFVWNVVKFCFFVIDNHKNIPNYAHLIEDPLITSIDQEVEKLTEIESNLATVAATYKSIIGKLTKLILSLDHYPNSYRNQIGYLEMSERDVETLNSLRKFCPKVKEKIVQVVKVVNHTQTVLKSNIAYMGELKVRAKQSEQQFISKASYKELTDSRDTIALKLIVQSWTTLLNIVLQPENKLDADQVYELFNAAMDINAAWQNSGSLRSNFNFSLFPFSF